MHDQQVRTPLDGLLRDRPCGVDREHHLVDVGVRITRHQTDGVPRVGGRRWIPAVEQVDDVTQARHAGKAS